MRALACAIVALVVVGVAAAAQGDPKKVIIASVQAKAKAINVQLTDLSGTGWKPHTASSKGSTPKCSYYNPDQADLTENGDADSPEFTLPTGSFVSSTTGIFKTAQQGRTAYSRVVQPALPKCLAEVFRKGTGHPDKVTIVSAAAVSFPNLADRTNAYRIVAAFKTSPKVTVGVYLDVITLNRGKVDVALFFAGIGGSFNSDFERTVAGRIAARTASVH